MMVDALKYTELKYKKNPPKNRQQQKIHRFRDNAGSSGAIINSESLIKESVKFHYKKDTCQ